MNPEFWKNKQVLLTGHTGFKGSWLSIWLQKLGVNLVGYSKSIPTKPSLFELAHVKEGMESITGDVCDSNYLHDVIKKYKPEIVIHMAAQSLVRQSYANPSDTYATNVMGSVNLLETIRTVGCSRVVINVTSDKCYENKNLSRGYHEEDPLGGYDPYSSSKGCAELVTASYRNSFFNPKYFEKHKTAVATVRAGNVIGGGDWAEDRLVPDIMRGILGNRPIKIRHPDAIRPWQYVLEPLNGYLTLAEHLWDHGPNYVGAWNFGPNEDDLKPVSWLIDKISKKWGDKISWHLEKDGLHEASILKLDCNKAKTKLGWNPKTSLESAINFVVNWYKNYAENKDVRRYTEEQIETFVRL